MSDSFRRNRFDENTRQRLRAAFSTAFIKSRAQFNPDNLKDEAQRALWAKHAEREADIFVGCIERLPAGREVYENVRVQKKRREQIKAFANHLDNVVDAALKMDESSLGYALWRGLEELVKEKEFADDADRETVGGLCGYPMTVFAYDLQKRHRAAIARFAYGVRQASRDLPPLESASFEQRTAEWLENYLGRQSIPFTTSATGLAGLAFAAVMDLAGVTASAKHHLSSAAKNPGSWKKFVQRMAERFPKTGAE